MEQSREYVVWCHAKSRCFNPKNKDFHHYGGRGITMCDEWKNDFSAFLRDMGLRPRGMTIGRMNNDGNYEPGNCRWETRKQQALNTRRTRYVTINGVTKPFQQWADERGLTMHEGKMAHKRLMKGVPAEMIFR